MNIQLRQDDTERKHVGLDVVSLSSGAIQSNVPTQAVIVRSRRSREIPKSDSFAFMSPSSRTFLDLRSRWIMGGNSEWRYVNAWQTLSAIEIFCLSNPTGRLEAWYLLSEIAAFDELQDDTEVRERLPRNASKCHDVRVVQRSGHLCFREEFVDRFEASP